MLIFYLYYGEKFLFLLYIWNLFFLLAWEDIVIVSFSSNMVYDREIIYNKFLFFQSSGEISVRCVESIHTWIMNQIFIQYFQFYQISMMNKYIFSLYSFPLNSSCNRGKNKRSWNFQHTCYCRLIALYSIVLMYNIVLFSSRIIFELWPVDDNTGQTQHTNSAK